MSDSFAITAEIRSDKGKGASRRLRHANQVPGIIYGGGAEPTVISIEHDHLFHALENQAIFSNIVKVAVDGKEEEVVIKDLQRHPYKPKINHIDFLRANAEEEIVKQVPLKVTGREKCSGLKLGGQLHMTEKVIHVKCLSKNLPEAIEFDIADMEVGTTLHISDLNLPEGVSSVRLNQGQDLLVARLASK
jgi:large subunit ribosomal protein L25